MTVVMGYGKPIQLLKPQEISLFWLPRQGLRRQCLPLHFWKRVDGLRCGGLGCQSYCQKKIPPHLNSLRLIESLPISRVHKKCLEVSQPSRQVSPLPPDAPTTHIHKLLKLCYPIPNTIWKLHVILGKKRYVIFICFELQSFEWIDITSSSLE